MALINKKQISHLQYPIVWQYTGSELINGLTGHGVGSDTNTSGWHIRPNYPMYFGGGKFVKVYRDGTELVYDQDFKEGKAIFRANDLVPSIRLHSSQYSSSSNYTVEYYEQVDTIDPFVYVFRPDGRPLNPTNPTRRIAFDDGSVQWNGVIWQITEVTNFVYDIEYRSTDSTHTHTVRKTYGTSIAVRQYKEGVAFPGNIRMEMWSRGKVHGGPGAGPASNVNYNPIATSTTNRWDFDGFVNGYPRHRVYVKVRIRDTDSNIVSALSSRVVVAKRIYMWQEGYYGDTPLGEIFISKLI